MMPEDREILAVCSLGASVDVYIPSEPMLPAGSGAVPG
ncbi:hypothetical protein C1A50_0717 [Paenibacillus polymyxa]|nr:hypothetical protein C1A50_0717 [Paenibacillus polymyxa]